MTASSVVTATTSARGYATAGYADTLGHIGAVVALPRSGAHVLRREIPDVPATDLLGTYPLTPVVDAAAFVADLDALPDLGCTAVTEPLGSVGEDELRAHVRGHVRPWKLHHVVDASRPDARSTHHGRNVRRASVDVAVGDGSSSEVVAAWLRLYGLLRRQHAITGAANFPAEALRAQLGLPDVRVYVARADGAICGIVTVLRDGNRAWYHLGATDDVGRERRAMFGLFDLVLRDVVTLGVQRLDLGAGAGTTGESDGLARFKAGWANSTAPTYLVHHVVDPAGQQRAMELRGAHDFLPPYRSTAP